jgi:hypothetical protein
MSTMSLSTGVNVRDAVLCCHVILASLQSALSAAQPGGWKVGRIIIRPRGRVITTAIISFAGILEAKGCSELLHPAAFDLQRSASAAATWFTERSGLFAREDLALKSLVEVFLELLCGTLPEFKRSEVSGRPAWMIGEDFLQVGLAQLEEELPLFS